MPGCSIGAGCIFGQNVFIAAGVRVGNNVKVQNNVSLYEGVVLEDDVFCGPSSVFTNVINPRSQIVRRNEYQPTVIRRGATLGANCTTARWCAGEPSAVTPLSAPAPWSAATFPITP
jgi:UDP-2-acetamido-3-amino-2,3-dideoxy-glucuronate N-acetyltransferase